MSEQTPERCDGSGTLDPDPQNVEAGFRPCPGCPACAPDPDRQLRDFKATGGALARENDLVRQDVAEDHRRAWDAEVERASQGENDETMTAQRKAE